MEMETEETGRGGKTGGEDRGSLSGKAQDGRGVARIPLTEHATCSLQVQGGESLNCGL